jgi:hypothetical protein
VVGGVVCAVRIGYIVVMIRLQHGDRRGRKPWLVHSLVQQLASEDPSCAYDDQWLCPLAPPENRVTAPIRAGELTYHRSGGVTVSGLGPGPMTNVSG